MNWNGVKEKICKSSIISACSTKSNGQRKNLQINQNYNEIHGFVTSHGNKKGNNGT